MKWLTFGDDVGFGRQSGFSSTPSPQAWASTPGYMTSRPQVGVGETPPAPPPATPDASRLSPPASNDLLKLVTITAGTKPTTMSEAMTPLVVLLALGLGAAAMGSRRISDPNPEE